MTHDPKRKPGNNPRTQEKARKAAEERDALLRDIAGTFGSPAGLRTLDWIRAATGYDLPRFRGPVPAGYTVDQLAAFRDGQAQVYRDILDVLRQAETGDRPAARA